MDIFFQDLNEVPLPPEEVRIRSLKVEPWGDGRRVKVYLEIDAFQKQTNVEVYILTSTGQEAATATIVETMTRYIEINLHLRQAESSGKYQVEAVLSYSQGFSDAEMEAGGEPGAMIEVDRQRLGFNI